MRTVLLALACGVIAMSTPAHAEDATKPAASPPVLHKPRAGRVRVGEEGARTTTYVEPKKSKQDIEDEKKLERDMKICIGC